MGYELIEVIPVTPLIGAEVGGVDLRRPSNRQFEEFIRPCWSSRCCSFATSCWISRAK